MVGQIFRRHRLPGVTGLDRRADHSYFFESIPIESIAAEAHVRDHLRRRLQSAQLPADVPALPPLRIGGAHRDILHGLFFDI